MAVIADARRNLRAFFRSEARTTYPYSLSQWMADLMSYAGNTYPVTTDTGLNGAERIGAGFAGLVAGAAKANGVVFGCMVARQSLFQEARFLFRELNEENRPGRFFWHPNLRPLEHPWPNGTTGDLLARSMQMVDIAGNAFVVRTPGGQLAWLRPDWVTIVARSPNEDAGVWDPEAVFDGIIYEPGGPTSKQKPVVYTSESVCHWAPIPDPVSRFRGMSWVSTILEDIEADRAATLHKRAFLSNGATPNMIVHFDPAIVDTLEKFNAYVDAIERDHAGAANAYKTLYMVGAHDAKAVGANFQQLELKSTQGAGETRIAMAAGVPAVILGISEGLQGSSLNAGNYDAAFQRFADLTIRPLWRNWAGSMETLIRPPGPPSPNARGQLWYDDRDIPALREDEHEKAEIQKLQAEAVAGFIMQGFTHESAVDAVATGELSKLRPDPRRPLSVQVQSGPVPPGGNGNAPQNPAETEKTPAAT